MAEQMSGNGDEALLQYRLAFQGLPEMQAHQVLGTMGIATFKDDPRIIIESLVRGVLSQRPCFPIRLQLVRRSLSVLASRRCVYKHVKAHSQAEDVYTST